MEGGDVLLGDGEDEEPQPLPPGRTLTLLQYMRVEWEDAPSWTGPKIQNQMRLHNLRAASWSDQLKEKLKEKEMLGRGGVLRVSFPNKKAALDYLKLFLQLEKQVAQMVREIQAAEERAAQQEQRDQRARRSGRGRRTSGDQAGVR